MEEDDRSNINEDSGSMDDREEEDEEEFNSGGDEEGSVEEDDAESEEEGDDDGDDSGSDSDSGESDSDEDEDESSSDEDDDDDDDDGEGGDEPKDGLSAYERLRLQRIARNEARLSSLGLQQMSDEIKKSKEEKKQQRRRNRQPAFDGPRRQLPGRSARATSFFIAEQSEKIVTATDNTPSTPSLPKQKKIKKNLDACWTCQDDTGELHMCDFCRKLYHPTCDSNLNNEDAAPDDDFKCTICEKEGKNRRVPCGRCEGCKREWDCETCVYCKRKMAADEEASVRQKCIFRKCRNWGMRATVTMGEDGDGEDGGEDDDEETDDGHDAECNVCHTGGDLICCDGCPFVFHSDCHKPKIITLPDGEWFCMHCNKKPKAPKEKKSKYVGPLLADLGDREVTCVVQFPKLECLVCEGIEVTGAKKELDWTTCKICDDSFHLQCLDPPLETRPTSFRCPSCKESKRRGVPKEKKAKPLFEGVHDDDCYICRNGGNLVCCDFCEKAFHCECHIPPLPGIPTTATWKCCECAALEYKRKFRCGECSACKVKEDCGKCYSCGDKPKFGGRGLHKQGCEKRKCPYMRFAPPANANESKSKRKHFLIDGDDSPKKHKKHKKKKKLKKVKTREERLMEISAQVSDDIGDVDYDAFINRKKIKGDPVGNMILIIMKKAFGMADDAKVQEAALEHLRFIVKTAENAERAIKLGALKMVSKTMNDHPEKGSVQAVANAFLAELVWVHPPSIITILRSGCLPLVLKSMDFHDKHVQVCTSAISVFRAMSYDFSNHWICNNINATTSIIESMKINQTNSEVLKEGCLFLQNIICNHEISSDTIDLIVSSGTIPIIVGAMSSPMETVVECACGLLGNLAIDDDIREEIGTNSSSIAILLRILTTNPDEDVSKSAMIALKRISSDNEDNITKIVEQDGVNGVLEFLKGKSIDKDLLATGFGLLSHLTKSKSSNTSQLLDFVISEMRNHPNQPQLQAGTCSVIRNLSVDDVEQAKVANALVVAAMNRHQSDSRVQLNCCQALLNLYIQFPSIIQPLMQQEPLLFDSQSPKRKRRKVEKITADEQGVDGTADRLLEKNALGTKIIPEIKHVLRPLKNVLNNDAVGNQIRLIIITALRNIDNYKMQTTACEHLRYLVTSIKTCSTIVKLGGLKMIHISVNQHPRKTAFVAEAINLLLDLISANPSVIASIVQEGLLDLVIESMYSNGHNSRVQRASLGIFRALSYDFTKHSDIQNVKGVEGVIESMKRNPKKFDIMKDVCLILQNFLSNEERRQGTIELVTSLNVTPVVIDGMYANQDMGFLVAACGLLANLAMDEDAKIAISDYVLSIRTLLAILELNNIDADVSMSTLTALRLLLADNHENRCKIAEVGGMKTVIDFLTAPREVIVAESGLELLAEMIKNNADNSEQLKVCGGIQFVTSLMKGKPRSAAVQAVGCRILCAFTNPSYGVSAHPIQVEEADEALKLVLSVMKSHRNNNSVQLASSHALLHFCTLFPTLIKSLDSSILRQSAFRTGIFSY